MMTNRLPTLSEAQAIVQAHHFARWAEHADHAELARVAEETLVDADDDADATTKQILADAIYAEATLRGSI